MGVRIVDTKELKEIQIQILREVDQFCSQHNIQYFLMYGSLIGAIRHHGIIPWDDDIDICMDRNNYNKFLDTFPGCGFKSIYIKEQSKDAKFPFYYTKVCRNGSHAYEPIDQGEYDVGISIDLFPLDYIPDDRIKKRKQEIIIKWNRIKLIPHTVDYNHKRKLYKKICLSFLAFLFRKPAYFYVNKIRQFLLKNNCKSKYVTEIMTPYGNKAIFPSEWFSEYVCCPFEGMMIPVPKEYDHILTQLYGDYMSPPPVEEQVTHHSFKAFVECKENSFQ